MKWNFLCWLLFILCLCPQVVTAGQVYNFSTQWGGHGSGDGQLFIPHGVAADSAGNVYVVEYGNDRVQKFTSSGIFISKWGTTGEGPGQFDNPQAVAVDKDNNVYVVENKNSRVQKFTSDGKFITQWKTAGAKTETSSASSLYGDPWAQEQQSKDDLTGPSGIAVDTAGNVYVSDTRRDNIQKYSSTGEFLLEWGAEGSGDGLMQDPEGVAVDTAGNVYVADKYNSRVQIFNPRGQLLKKWGSKGLSPDAIAVDSAGYVYTVEAHDNVVHKFTSNGDNVTQWGEAGPGDGRFHVPNAITVDSSGNVYVSDMSNNLIQKFIRLPDSILPPGPEDESGLFGFNLISILIGLLCVGLIAGVVVVKQRGGSKPQSRSDPIGSSGQQHTTSSKYPIDIIPHDVMISYSTLDKPTADAVCAGLEMNNIRCWIAPRDVLPGMNYAEAIVRAIETSKILVLIYSANANRSDQVLRELEIAATSKVIIIPFRIEDAPLTKAMQFYIKLPHWLDALTPPIEDHIEALSTSIRSFMTSASRKEK